MAGMEKTDILIIGGSAAGIVTGVTARVHHEHAQISLIRREKQVLVPCGIPYIFGTIGSPEKNLIPDALLSKNNIELIVDEAISIDRTRRAVATSNGSTIGYERLVLATGSSPIIPGIPGVELGNVFLARKDIEYLKNLSNALEDAEHVLVIGGGFVGMEFADEFRKRGLDVTIVEMLPHCLELAYDEEFCVLAEKRLSERGVKTRVNGRVEAILGDEKVERVRLNTGEELIADLVVVAIGVVPNTKLAEETGLRMGQQKAVWVDQYMRTSDKTIFAVGDCAEKTSFFTRQPVAFRLASVAAREGRIAGANLFEPRRRNEGTIGTFSTTIGDHAMCAVGLTEKTARGAMYEPVIGMAMGPDKHPASMPNASEMKVKLVFDKATGELLGGQVCCGPTSGEVANILAAMIQKRMTMDEIAAFQMGTHPALTGSPITYQIANAAEDAAVRRSSKPSEVTA